MTTVIKAIPTRYRGQQFRSRLESRWAEALDRLEMPWLYEAEGFEFGDGLRYLPDFYLPDQRVFLEVKGVLDGRSWDKVASLITHVRPHGIGVVLATQDGWIEPVGPWPSPRGEAICDPVRFGVALCSSCARWYFLHTGGDKTCRCCELSDQPVGWFTRLLPRWAWP